MAPVTNSNADIVRRHAWEGLLTGLLVAVVHIELLASGGLFVLVDASDVARSVARYTGLFALAGGAIGLVIGMLLIPDTRFRNLTFRQPIRPAPLVVIVLYAGPWLVFLTEDIAGRQALRTAVLTFAVVLVLLLIAVFVWLGRFHPKAASFFVPRRSLGILTIACAALYFLPMLKAPEARPAEAMLPTSPLDALRADSFGATERWNLLLLTVDTLRADHLGMYGYYRDTSPVLDALSKSGVRFDSALCPRPKTSPSFATIMTGTHPARHGIHGAMQRLAADNETLAEYLQSAGWKTGAVITNGNLYPTFAFDQGFQNYAYGHGGEEAAGLSLEWLDQNAQSDEPWFLWVHYTNPHVPYSPPPPYNTMFTAAGATHLEQQVALYDGEIRFTDHELGRILAWLDASGQRDRTLIVFTADHGESLGEHDYYFAHGLHPYEPSSRIPLVISAAGVVPARRTTDAMVAAVDILPTILDALGIETLDDVQGRSFLPLAIGLSDEAPRDFAMIEAGYGGHSEAGETIALRRPSTKYVHRLRSWAMMPPGLATVFWTVNARIEGGLRPDELYDLESDPLETDNILTKRRSLSLEERRILRAYAAEVYSSGRRHATAPEALDPKTYQSLKNLGYL
jgi:arylsulfatase A-like enzyme